MSELREKDMAVLQAVRDGATTTSEIREATTLTNREINYSLTEYSLEKQGFVGIKRRRGREWREMDGSEKNVWKPKRIHLTDKALRELAQIEKVERYEDMNRKELIERIYELEDRMDRFEAVFKDFRQSVMEQI